VRQTAKLINIYIYMHFISSFIYCVFNAWIRSVLPKHVAGVDGTNTVCCGSLQYVYQFVILCVAQGWILQKVVQMKF
jgi:hypothetical protein